MEGKIVSIVQDRIGMLKAGSEIEVLNLSNAGLLDSDIKTLVDLLRTRKYKVHMLELSYNNITSEGVSALAKLATVKEVNLSHNSVSSSKKLEALMSNIKIRKLNLSDNNLSDNAAEIIINCSRQIEINVEGNDISEKNCQRIKEHLSNNSAAELKKMFDY